MARPKKPDTRVPMAIRFPPKIKKELERHAAERDVSVNFLVNRAVEKWLANPPELP